MAMQNQEAIEYGIYGTSGGDTLNGSSYRDWMYGYGGSDIMYGANGDDYLDGGAGDDYLIGGYGADFLVGGSGFDTVLYNDGVGVTVQIEGQTIGREKIFNAGGATGDTISETVESVVGSHFADRISGNDSDNLLIGGLGDDVLYGFGGADELEGGQGRDVLYGGTGNDTVIYKYSGGGVFVDLGGGFATGGNAEGDWLSDDIENIEASPFRDVIVGSSVDNQMYLNGGDDSASGNSGNDYIHGGDGSDVITGDAGEDYLYGDNGDDRLYGGAQDDSLTGGTGNDRLSGGAGADGFNFLQSDLGGVDTIVDFNRFEGDKIRLGNIDANINLAGNQAFTFIGMSEFSHHAGQLRYSYDGLGATITGDVDGDAVADFTIVLISNVSYLTAADFQL